MKITIHRGTNQIGGCITEIQSAKGNKILIDLGHNLPNGDDNADDVLDKQENLNAILKGVSDIFYSHYHGDHIGIYNKVNSNNSDDGSMYTYYPIYEFVFNGKTFILINFHHLIIYR